MAATGEAPDTPARPPGLGFGRWPLTVVLPVGVAVGIFAVALGTTRIGLEVLKEREARALESKATVLLDTLAGVATSRIPDGPTAVETVLRNAHTFKAALEEEDVAAVWRLPDGTRHAVAYTNGGSDPTLAATLSRLENAPPGDSVSVHDVSGNRAVFGRVYEAGATRLVLVAGLDTRPLLAERHRDERIALLLDILIAGFAAALTFFLVRRAIAPLDAIARRLATGESGQEIVAGGRIAPEFRRLERAIGDRLVADRKRADTIADLGERERDALLAKLAAGLAHEVRNPLAGLLNAVSTLRRFGDDRAAREDTLDIVERGLRSIERVADAMLSTYRPAGGRMMFGPADMEDLKLLAGPEARRRRVRLAWDVAGLEPIRIEADGLRQILLNLLLNACKASPEDGEVQVSVVREGPATIFVIADSGPGMSDDIVAFLAGASETAVPPRRGLGLWMVTRLADDLGARLRVESRGGEGTRVSVTVGALEAGRAA